MLLGGGLPLFLFLARRSRCVLCGFQGLSNLPQVPQWARACALRHPMVKRGISQREKGLDPLRPRSQQSQAGLHSEWAPEPLAAFSCAHHRSGAQRATSVPPAPVQTERHVWLACSAKSAAFSCIREHALGARGRSGPSLR